MEAAIWISGMKKERKVGGGRMTERQGTRFEIEGHGNTCGGSNPSSSAMSHKERLHAAIQAVAQKLMRMPTEEFKAELEKHANGDVALALRDLWGVNGSEPTEPVLDTTVIDQKDGEFTCSVQAGEYQKTVTVHSISDLMVRCRGSSI